MRVQQKYLFMYVCVYIFLFSIEFAQTVEKCTNWMELSEKIVFILMSFTSFE